MKIISWNVNGIRSILKKGFIDFVKKELPDVLCIQETKAHLEQVDKMLPDYVHCWNSAKKKGYAGTAIFTKIKPIAVTYGLENKKTDEADEEGRILTLEFSHYFLVTVYTPNSGRGLPRLKFREHWDKEFLAFLKKLEHQKPVIFCGDLNVAHTEKDLANPKGNYNKTAGYTQIEIDGFSSILHAGFVDTWRTFHKNKIQYTYWSYRFNARKKNIGWRIDYFCVSKRFLPHVKSVVIMDEIHGSDHCPVKIETSV